jgi:hypothetical protein
MVHDGTLGESVNAAQLFSEAFAFVEVRKNCHINVGLACTTFLNGGWCAYREGTFRNHGVIQYNRFGSNN